MPFDDLHIVPLAYLPDQLPRAFRYRTTKNAFAVFHDPHKVHFQIVYTMGGLAVFIHTANLTQVFALRRGIFSHSPRTDIKDNSSFTTIITLYDVLDILFREGGNKWNEYKRQRPNDDEITRFYNDSVRFWNTMAKQFTSLGRISSSQPSENVAGDHRHRKGGSLLFRPIGLLIVANVVRKAKETGLSENEAIKRISTVSMEISDRPWVGLLWDRVNQRMINERSHQKVARNLLYYIIGGNLADMNTSYEKLLQEYAGVLNRDESELTMEVNQGQMW